MLAGGSCTPRSHRDTAIAEEFRRLPSSDWLRFRLRLRLTTRVAQWSRLLNAVALDEDLRDILPAPCQES